jgi:hypothetical protein
MAAAERRCDQVGLKPDGPPNRRGSPVYVAGGYDAEGNVTLLGAVLVVAEFNAEDIVQERMPGAQMTEPYVWRRNRIW